MKAASDIIHFMSKYLVGAKFMSLLGISSQRERLCFSGSSGGDSKNVISNGFTVQKRKARNPPHQRHVAMLEVCGKSQVHFSYFFFTVTDFRFPALPDFLRSNVFGTESTKPRNYN
jgi:hypothetical protein